MAVVVVVYSCAGAAMALAAGNVRHVVEDELAVIELVTELPPEPAPVAPPSEPQTVPAPAPVAAAPRPKIKQPEPVRPEALVDEQVAESSVPVAETNAVGPVDGVVGGVVGGTGTAPAPAAPLAVAVAPAPLPPRPEPLVPPVEQVGNPHPRYSLLAKRNGIEGLVVVTFEVLEDGRVASPRILSGPEELYESVLKAVSAWRFQPARRGRVAVRHKVTRQIRFQLEDA